MKLRAGDSVVVTTGKDKGKTGQILKVLPLKGRVVVAGINMRKRHMPKRANQAGQIITYEASIHGSNVMIVDPKTKKPSRIGITVDDKGRRQRIAKKSGTVITTSKPKAATTSTKSEEPAKATKAAPSTSTKATADKKKTAAKKEKVVASSKATDKASKKETTEAPASKPFWKRLGGFGSTEIDEDTSE
jgi:large subunit ribosomal protein L24